jgi:hypothetical protein
LQWIEWYEISAEDGRKRSVVEMVARREEVLKIGGRERKGELEKVVS